MDEDQINNRLENARKRVEQGVAAGNFLKTPEGNLVQEWINERISYLLEKMTSSTAMSDREYLAAHGAVRELKEFNVMLNAKARNTVSAQEEMKVLNEQRAAVEGQDPIKF